MKKRFIASLVTATLALSVFSACGSNETQTAEMEALSESAEEQSVEEKSDESTVEQSFQEVTNVEEEPAWEQPVLEEGQTVWDLGLEWDAFYMTNPAELEVIPEKGTNYGVVDPNDPGFWQFNVMAEESYELEDFTWKNESGTYIWNHFKEGFFNSQYGGHSFLCFSISEDEDPLNPDSHYYLGDIDLNTYSGMDIFKLLCDKWGYCSAYYYEDDSFGACWTMHKDNPIIKDLPIDYDANDTEYSNNDCYGDVGCTIVFNVYSPEAPTYYDQWYELVTSPVGERIENDTEGTQDRHSSEENLNATLNQEDSEEVEGRPVDDAAHMISIQGQQYNMIADEVLGFSLVTYTYEDCTEKDGIEALIERFAKNFGKAKVSYDEHNNPTELIWKIGPEKESSLILIGPVMDGDNWVLTCYTP